MARLSDADQGRFPVPRLNFGGTHRSRFGVVPRFGEALSGAARHRYPGVAELLLQVSDDGAWAVSRARSVHPVDEAEEHAAPPHGRRDDHAPGAGVLRLAVEMAADCPCVAGIRVQANLHDPLKSVRLGWGIRPVTSPSPRKTCIANIRPW